MQNLEKNIKLAKKLSASSESVKLVALVSGSEASRRNWEVRMRKMAPCIFNRDSTTMVLSLLERAGDKTREGNFLGTLLAYENIKKASREAGYAYRDHVSLIGMIFGRGERMSPVTQAEGDCKPAVKVTPALIDINGTKEAFSAIEEALFYFAPVAKCLEDRGFKGVLNKWGDETQIPSVDLSSGTCENADLSEYDVIKMVSVMEITDELARQKDWVVFGEDNDMIAQVSRAEMPALIEELKMMGVKPREDGKFYAGISLGPVAISYDVLDVALEVFGREMLEKGVYFDFDPYFLMALAMEALDHDEWYRKAGKDKDLKELVGMIPDFFEKVQTLKDLYKDRNGRDLNFKVVDLGKDTYWSDIGQHSAMRNKYLSLNAKDEKGALARMIANVPDERDAAGNIIVDSKISADVNVKDSVLVNVAVKGKGNISGCVMIDSEFGDIDARGAFVVRSKRTGKTVLEENSGMYNSIGSDDINVDRGMRHVSVLTSAGRTDLVVKEDTDLRDKDNTYNVPVFGNSISFEDAYEEMFGLDIEELEKRRNGIWKDTN